MTHNILSIVTYIRLMHVSDQCLIVMTIAYTVAMSVSECGNRVQVRNHEMHRIDPAVALASGNREERQSESKDAARR